MPRSPVPVIATLIVLVACASDTNSPVAPGVTVRDVALPVAGAVYRGSAAHVFMDSQVALFCGIHGSFSTSATPPQAIGETVLSEYTATFVGELTLQPPLVSSAVTHPLSLTARMAESITLTSTSGGTTTYATELVTFELPGTAMPDGIMVRESPDRASSGVTTVTALSGDQSRVETTYDVWLEVSVDSGRTWNLAEQAVRMTLEPS